MSTESMVQVDAARLAKLEDMERKQKLSARRASIKNLLFVEKAKKAGIKVSKEEVDAKMASESAGSVPAYGSAAA
jgi:hypothetical protein